jgi:putative two-component system response regulator
MLYSRAWRIKIMSNQIFKIMIVDDIAANLEVLEDLLASKGYQVAAFPRGDLALSFAFQNPPDLIFLDIMMPFMDGFEVCKQLKLDTRTQDIPVIFISALDDTENKVKAFTHGGVDYISKPFQEAEVFARLQTHLKLRQSQKQLEAYAHDLESLVQEKVQEISDSQMATLIALSNLAEYRDETTGSHIDRTRDYCKLLAEYLMKDEEYSNQITSSFINDIYFAAPLHDIGKVGIPDSILLKPGKLRPQEYEIMKTHVTIGAATLEQVLSQYPKNTFINMGVLITKHHHERWDGTGYPSKLKGNEIPLAARIMAIADVYDALRSRRPYKAGISHTESVEIIVRDSEKSFDPKIVKAFVELEKEFELIFEHHTNSNPLI